MSHNSPSIVIREIGQPAVTDFEGTSARFVVVDTALKNISRIISSMWTTIANVVNFNANLILIGSAAPTADAVFEGQMFIDTTNDDAYIAIDVGAGASDWKKTTP